MPDFLDTSVSWKRLVLPGSVTGNEETHATFEVFLYGMPCCKRKVDLLHGYPIDSRSSTHTLGLYKALKRSKERHP